MSNTITTVHRRSVLMVCSRPITAVGDNGRERTMHLIHEALLKGGYVEVLEIVSTLQATRFGDVLFMLASWLCGLLVGRRMPFQSLLFWQPRNRRAIEDAVNRLKPDTVYFDGVRTGSYLLGLRKRHNNLRLVCDFDDLMSRRMKRLLEERQPVSLGYLTKYVPNWISQLVIQPLASNLIPMHEARTLVDLEAQIVASADAVVLVSSLEADQLKYSLSTELAIKVKTIPPSVPHVESVMVTPLEINRFVFVGTDRQLQNRLTIEALVEMWSRLRPTTQLHIYGDQNGNYAQVPGIVVHGFVDNIAQAYAPGSVMLAPSFVSGGVKSKVLEAFAYGIPVVGNKSTFEGIDAPTQPLAMDMKRIEALVRSPSEYAEKLSCDTQAAINIARDRHSPTNLSQRWRNIVWPE